MFLTIVPGIWNTNNPLFTDQLRAAEQMKWQAKWEKNRTRVSDKDWWVPTSYILERFIQQSHENLQKVSSWTREVVSSRFWNSWSRQSASQNKQFIDACFCSWPSWFNPSQQSSPRSIHFPPQWDWGENHKGKSWKMHKLRWRQFNSKSKSHAHKQSKLRH